MAFRVEQRANGLDGRVEQRRQLDAFGSQCDRPALHARQVEQLVEQQIHGLALPCDHAGGPAQPVGRQVGASQQLGRHPDRGERIAQFVRERGEEFVLALIGQVQCFGRERGLGDVDVHPDPFAQRAAGLDHGHRADRELAPGSVAPLYPVLEGEQALFGHRFAPGIDRRLRVFRVHGCGPAEAAVFGFGLTGEGCPARLCARHAAVGVVGPHHADGLDRGAEALIAALQARRHRGERRNVAIESRDAACDREHADVQAQFAPTAGVAMLELNRHPLRHRMAIVRLDQSADRCRPKIPVNAADDLGLRAAVQAQAFGVDFEYAEGLVQHDEAFAHRVEHLLAP